MSAEARRLDDPSTQKNFKDISFPKALVGNRVLSIRITSLDKTIVVMSDDHPGVLYLFPRVNEYRTFLTALSEKLSASSCTFVGMRIKQHIDIPQLIACVDGPESVVMPLIPPNNKVWAIHLERFFGREQIAVAAVLRENELLKSALTELRRENEILRAKTEFQQKEVDLLRLLVNTRPDSTRSAIQTTREEVEAITASAASAIANLLPFAACTQIQNTKSPTPTPAPTPTEEELKPEFLISVEASTSQEQDETVPPEAEETMDQDEQASSSPSSPQQLLKDSSFSKAMKAKSEDVLRGVAQFILCQLCPEESEDFKGMENHFLSAHIDKEKKNCEACPSEQLTDSDLAQHMQQHTNRVYACGFCGKRGRKHFLKAHVRTHTGEKPFACETCGRSFADGSTLRRHRLVHSGEKKHSCPICGRGIARKDNVKVHIRSHGLKEDQGILSSAPSPQP